MSNPLTGVLTPRQRKLGYAIYAAIGIAFGAVQVGYSSLDEGQPSWLVAAIAVYAYLGVAVSGVAASNVRSRTE